MSLVDLLEHVVHFLVYRLSKILSGEFQSRLDQVRILLDGHVWVFIFVIQYPALALCHYLVAEFLSCQLVTPLPERAFGEFLDIAFVYQGDRLASTL